LTEYGAILTEDEINERLISSDPNEKIYITPLLSKKQINGASIDVRLGNSFIIFRRTKYSGLDVLKESKDELASRIEEFQEKIYVPLGKKLFLHPQQLVLGSTLEYVRLPPDLVAEVVGRSSWGRLGLILSAATLIHPDFAGVITLELANQADVPIPLVPGVRIAQLVLKKTTKNVDSTHESTKSKYHGAVEPEFSLLHEDKDLTALKKIGNHRID
jgi:dCTP deaminase